MTKNPNLKDRIRARMARTGESYTAARAGLQRQGAHAEPTLRAVSEALARADDRMTEIARRFPLLRPAVEHAPFQGERFLRWLALGHSTSALRAGQFVLHVWQPDTDFVALGRELGLDDAHVAFAPFDLSRALGGWDEAHRVAFLAWADPVRFAGMQVDDENEATTPAEAFALLERARERESARRRRWPQTPHGTVDTSAAMTALARSFPSLREAEGLAPFRVPGLQQWVATHPEAAPSARFLLHVWNSDGDYADAARERNLPNAETLFAPFRLVPTFEAWDAEHRRAFLAWAEAPFWP